MCDAEYETGDRYKRKVEEVHRRAKEESLVHVIQLGSMTMGECGEELSDIEGMAQAGCYALSEDGNLS